MVLKIHHIFLFLVGSFTLLYLAAISRFLYKGESGQVHVGEKQIRLDTVIPTALRSNVIPSDKDLPTSIIPLELDNTQAPIPRATVAYAVSLTGCGSGLLTDGAAVLKHSIHLSSIHNKESGSLYSYKMYAIVHPSALSCSNQLSDAGYLILERDTPVPVSEIKGDYLRENVVNNGCCGEKEFIKLHAYTLLDHPVVVHLDLDTLVLRPMDELFDAMLEQDNMKLTEDKLFNSVIYHQGKLDGTAVFTSKTPTLPPRVEAFFTRDYNMKPSQKKTALVQGGFLVLRPSLETFREFQSLIRKGDFTNGGGWGGKGYSGYGAMTFQGIIPYFYDVIHPNTAIELNRCIYNQMCDNPRDQRTVNDLVSGNCRDGREDCEDCRAVDFHVVKTAHFTLCQKPWSCLPHTENSLQHRLCRKLHHAWFRIRNDLEQSTKKSNESGSFQPDQFYGYCNGSGERNYIPIVLPPTQQTI